MKKKVNKKFIVVLGLILIFSGFLYIYYIKNIINIKSTKDWLLYENKDLGISLKYPKKIVDGDLVFFQKSNIVFITTKSSNIYIHRDEIDSKDFVSIIKQARGLVEKYSPMNEKIWMILVNDTKSDNDLNNIIQKWFGGIYGFKNGCKLGNKYEILNKKGYYLIGVDSVEPNYDLLELSSCPINWRVNFEYNIDYNRSAIWDIGQTGQFYLGSCYDKKDDWSCFADDRMKDSFRFIETNKVN